MAGGGATTVEEYLESLDDERRATFEGLRAFILEHLPPGYHEQVLWGMPTYAIPLEVSGPTYNGKPLAPVSFAAQKRHGSLYLLMLYADSDEERSFRDRWSGPKRLDMGKSCVRFGRLEDLDLPLIGEVLAATTPDRFLASYRQVHPSS